MTKKTIIIFEATTGELAMMFHKRVLLLIIGVAVSIAGCRYAPKGSNLVVELGTPYKAEPANAELLYEKGDISLYAGETEKDIASNAENPWEFRNSLFLKRRKADGAAEWRMLLTTGSDCRDAEDGSSSSVTKYGFRVLKAGLSHDGRYIWLVCDPHVGTYYLVYAYDVCNNTFRYLTNGDDAIEQPDGTILVTGQKFYPKEDDGLGAAWRDVWLTPDGKIVREGEITLRGADL